MLKPFSISELAKTLIAMGVARNFRLAQYFVADNYKRTRSQSITDLSHVKFTYDALRGFSEPITKVLHRKITLMARR